MHGRISDEQPGHAATSVRILHVQHATNQTLLCIHPPCSPILLSLAASFSLGLATSCPKNQYKIWSGCRPCQNAGCPAGYRRAGYCGGTTNGYQCLQQQCPLNKYAVGGQPAGPGASGFLTSSCRPCANSACAFGHERVGFCTGTTNGYACEPICPANSFAFRAKECRRCKNLQCNTLLYKRVGTCTGAIDGYTCALIPCQANEYRTERRNWWGKVVAGACDTCTNIQCPDGYERAGDCSNTTNGYTCKLTPCPADHYHHRTALTTGATITSATASPTPPSSTANTASITATLAPTASTSPPVSVVTTTTAALTATAQPNSLGWAFDTDCKAGQDPCATKLTKKHCNGGLAIDKGQHSYATLTEAKHACTALGSTCFGVYDVGCAQTRAVYLCDASKIKSPVDLESSTSSCVYAKPAQHPGGINSITTTTATDATAAATLSPTTPVPTKPASQCTAWVRTAGELCMQHPGITVDGHRGDDTTAQKCKDLCAARADCVAINYYRASVCTSCGVPSRCYLLDAEGHDNGCKNITQTGADTYRCTNRPATTTITATLFAATTVTTTSITTPAIPTPPTATTISTASITTSTKETPPTTTTISTPTVDRTTGSTTGAASTFADATNQGCATSAESSWRMWGTHTCQQMQDHWKVCSTASDVNHATVTMNCPCTCSKYGVRIGTAVKIDTTTTRSEAHATPRRLRKDILLMQTLSQPDTSGSTSNTNTSSTTATLAPTASTSPPVSVVTTTTAALTATAQPNSLGWAFDTDCKAGQDPCATKLTKKHCNGGLAIDKGQHSYATLTEAKHACTALGSACFGVYDVGCTQTSAVYLCDASKIKSPVDLESSSSSCVYAKPAQHPGGINSITTTTNTQCRACRNSHCRGDQYRSGSCGGVSNSSTLGFDCNACTSSTCPAGQYRSGACGTNTQPTANNFACNICSNSKCQANEDRVGTCGGTVNGFSCAVYSGTCTNGQLHSPENRRRYHHCGSCNRGFTLLQSSYSCVDCSNYTANRSSFHCELYQFQTAASCAVADQTSCSDYAGECPNGRLISLAQRRQANQCGSCNAGYTVDAQHMCRPFAGNCTNGVLATQAARTQDSHCKACNTGYKLDGASKQCVPFSGNCDHGGFVAPQNTRKKDNECDTCQNGYDIRNGTCVAWAGTCANGRLISQAERKHDDHCGSCNNTGTGYTLLKRPAGAGTESSAMHKHTCERTCTEAGYRPDNCGLVCEPLETISSHHLVTSNSNFTFDDFHCVTAAAHEINLRYAEEQATLIFLTWAAIVLGAFSFALWLGCLVTRKFTCTRSFFSDSWLIILFALRTYDIVSDFAFRFISLKKGGAFDYATTTDADTVRLISLVSAILGAVLYIPSVLSLRAQASFYGPSSATAKWAFYVTMGILLFEDLPQAGITGLYLLELGFTRSYIATISFGCTCLMVLCALTGCCRGKPSNNTESDKWVQPQQQLSYVGRDCVRKTNAYDNGC